MDLMIDGIEKNERLVEQWVGSFGDVAKSRKGLMWERCRGLAATNAAGAGARLKQKCTTFLRLGREPLFLFYRIMK